jgi:predicted nucleotide-binding protein
MMAGKNKPTRDAEASSSGRVSQTELPSVSLDQALRIAKGLWDDFAGKSAAPHDIALGINMTPTSGPWRTLCGASIAYGLTEGGYNADEIKLLPLGRRIVAPEEEGDDARARVEALLKPRIMREFFQKYDRAKFPQDSIAQNVLVTLGLPKDRAPAALDAIKESGRKAGIIRDTKTGLFVALNLPKGSTGQTDKVEPDSDTDEEEKLVDGSLVPPSITPAANANRVFISHGKSRAIVTQIKELLTFGNLEPVVSVDRESTAIPVPEKVFEDMRSCASGVIHVSSEGELLDAQGNKHIHINQNVLIEIGAAMALYKKRVILLVEKGVLLPSNLQGLYRCEYSGDRLDYDATMKLLKTFNEFRAA